MTKELEKEHPEAYRLMLDFYTSPKYYDCSPECRPADNVLMAIQFTLDQVNEKGRAMSREIGHCSGHGSVPLFRGLCTKCLARDFPNGADNSFPAAQREEYAKFLADRKAKK